MSETNKPSLPYEMTNEHTNEQLDEQCVGVLRDLLREETTMPAGLVARLQVAVSRARRSDERFTAGERMLLATLLFTAIAYGAGSVGILAGALIAIVYGSSLNRLVGTYGLSNTPSSRIISTRNHQ